jgi:hypothetical protein
MWVVAISTFHHCFIHILGPYASSGGYLTLWWSVSCETLDHGPYTSTTLNFSVRQLTNRLLSLLYFTTGMVKDADGQRLRRRPNVDAVGVGYILGSPRSWPSA